MKKFMLLCLALAMTLSVAGCSEESADVGREGEDRWICGDAQTPEADSNIADEAAGGEEDAASLTVTCSIDLQGDTYQLNGNPAQELLTLLSALSYDRETCDGIPEYTVVCSDQTRYDLNLSSGWAWMGDKECKLSEDVIETLSALLSV